MVEDQKTIEEKSDAELVEMSKKDPEAYRFLLERYEKPLERFVRRAFQFSKEDTEDTLQETFIKIYRNLNEFDDQLKFSSWAYRIARNTAIDHSRKIKIRPQIVELEQEDWEKFFPADINIHKELENKDLLEKLKKIIAEMPENYKEALILRFLEEKSYEEIMDILKKPKGTVATLIDRGRKLLIEKVEINSSNLK